MAEQGGAEREFPRNLEAEQAVLGAVLLDNDALGRITSVLSEADFYRPAHRRIFRAMVELFDGGTPVDTVTLTNALRSQNALDEIGGVAYLAELADAIPAAATLQHYLAIVKDKSVLRGLVAACQEISEEAYEQPRELGPVLDLAEKRIFDLTQVRVSRDTAPLGEVLTRTFDMIEERSERQGDIVGVPTGYVDLDRMTAGLQQEELIILAARPSMGKTAFALNLTLNAAVQYGRPAAFFSLEMSKESLGMRFFSAHARVSADRLRKGSLTQEDWAALVLASEELAGVPLFLDDTPGISLSELRSKARRLVVEEGVQMLVLDYLQLMGTDKAIDSREQQIATLARGLKGLAKELHVPVIILSQLNRGLESRKDKRPMLSDLRESGAIEQDADVVMFIHRDDYYTKDQSERPNVAELEIAKQRNGPTGRVELYFNKEIGRFESYSGEPD